MIQKLNDLYGRKLSSLDGDIGQVKDFYFDDRSWVVRYLIADTGSWLTGRLVLISPHALGFVPQNDGLLLVNLTRKQIENSPSVDLRKPVSRQYESEFYKYYGLPSYWDGAAMWGLYGYPMLVPPSQEEMQREVQLSYHHRDDKHLQSAQSVKNYQIHAVDGEIGTVSGFMMDQKSWGIRDVVAETGHWYYGKEIRIPVGKVDRISYEESKVYVNLTRADILATKKDAEAAVLTT